MNPNHEFRFDDEKRAVAIMASKLTSEDVIVDALINSIAGDGASSLIDFVCFMGTFVYDKATNKPVDLTTFVKGLIEPETDALLMEYSREFQHQIKQIESTTFALAIVLFIERITR